MSYTTPTKKTCLRCGFQWFTRWRYLSQGEQATEPKRCARCRSPLWNTPKTHKCGPKSALEIQREGLGKKSAELQALLTGAGFVKGGGVSSDGLALVSRVAKARGIRDWPDTRHAADYDALQAAVQEELDFGRMNKELGEFGKRIAPPRKAKTSQSSMREQSKGKKSLRRSRAALEAHARRRS